MWCDFVWTSKWAKRTHSVPQQQQQLPHPPFRDRQPYHSKIVDSHSLLALSTIYSPFHIYILLPPISHDCNQEIFIAVCKSVVPQSHKAYPYFDATALRIDTITPELIAFIVVWESESKAYTFWAKYNHVKICIYIYRAYIEGACGRDVVCWIDACERFEEQHVFAKTRIRCDRNWITLGLDDEHRNPMFRREDYIYSKPIDLSLEWRMLKSTINLER